LKKETQALEYTSYESLIKTIHNTLQKKLLNLDFET